MPFPQGRSYAGASYVIFGSEGLPDTIDLATDADVDVLIRGAATDDYAGSSVSGAGDVNGDGVDDLFIGAAGADPDGRDNAGAGYVVLGSDQGLSDTVDLATDADLIIQGATASDYSNFSVGRAGDVNGDGIDDLITGDFRADPNGRDDAGASYVVFGTDLGLPAVIDLASEADLIVQGAAANDVLTSFSVRGAAGDVNGDGIDDLILGPPAADPNGRDYAGESYVVFGGPAAAIERLIAEVEAAGLLSPFSVSGYSSARSRRSGARRSTRPTPRTGSPTPARSSAP